jgi:hypothetical protein
VKTCPSYEHPKTIHVLNTLPWKNVAGKLNLEFEVGRSYLGHFFPKRFYF